MQAYDISAPLEEIKAALGDKIGSDIDPNEIEAELQKYLDYGVPPAQAVKTILRHHGVQGAAPAAAPVSDGPVKLADLKGNLPGVDVIARIVSYNVKTVHARGEEKEIIWGMLGDETATRSYTSWRPLQDLQKGDVIAVSGAYTKEWRNEIQINFGDRTRIEKRDDSEVPKVSTECRDAKIGELQAGDRSIRITGRVLDISARNITVQGEAKTIYGGTIADESGKVEFTSWAPTDIQADQVVTIEGGYVRAYRNTPQFNFDQDAIVTVADVELPDADTLADTPPVKLHTLVEQGGNDVTVVATLLEVRDGSGLVFRDPESNRVVTGSAAQGALPDLRIKGVLDDGTAALSMIANRELTEMLLGKNLEECQELAKESFRSEVIQEMLQEKLTGRIYKVRGNVLVDEFGAMLIAKTVVPFEGDVAERAQALLDSMEAN